MTSSNNHAIKQELMILSTHHDMEDITDEVDYCMIMFEMECNNILNVHSCKSSEALTWLIDTLRPNEVILIPNDVMSAWLFDDHMAHTQNMR